MLQAWPSPFRQSVDSQRFGIWRAESLVVVVVVILLEGGLSLSLSLETYRRSPFKNALDVARATDSFFHHFKLRSNFRQVIGGTVWVVASPEKLRAWDASAEARPWRERRRLAVVELALDVARARRFPLRAVNTLQKTRGYIYIYISDDARYCFERASHARLFGKARRKPSARHTLARALDPYF